jgi:tRNA G10  N-methylase Trm11
MKYFFVLGTNPTLSIAELTAVLKLSEKNDMEILPNNILVADVKDKINSEKLIYNLGGTIKIGEIIGERNNSSEQILAILKSIVPDSANGKFKFGFSNYSLQNVNAKVLGMELKKVLAGKKISARWVTGKEKILSSVIVEQNKLIQSGFEIVFMQSRDKLLIGRTHAVQPFKDLSFRDYGRPGRDDQSGMLPPKLAQIMINLSGAKMDDILLDPFCGSGTILTEAMLMGHSNLIGADISEKAIEDSGKNISWTKDSFQFSIFNFQTNLNFQLFNKNVLELSKFIKINSVGAIITEPYLGPQRGVVDIKKTINELEVLYSKSLLEFYKVLKPDGKVVMVWPVFVLRNAQRTMRTYDNYNPLDINLNKFKIVNPLPDNLLCNKSIKLTNRQTIIYGRESQKVWREIVILKK